MVIPARDEESTIATALEAVHRSAARLPADIRTHIIVVANGCRDETARRARSLGAMVVETGVANVGAARSTGAARAIRQSNLSPAELWISMTDADSTVPAQWLSAQVEAASRGADAFLGTIALDDVDAAAHPIWAARYAEQAQRHPHGHVHGANLGFRASTYLAVGGFGSLACHEDLDLLGRLRARGAEIAWTSEVAVVTSARHDPRALGGVGSDLAAIG